MTISDDQLIRSLRSRVQESPQARSVVSSSTLSSLEQQLEFSLPALLRRLYQEVADGGFGPAYGLLPVQAVRSTAGQEETLLAVVRKLARTPGWPGRLLPVCDWGSEIWSCLDCRSDDGPIVTLSGREGFANTGHGLRTWLEAWMASVDLWTEMFEPGSMRMGINPYTKQRIRLEGHGRPKGSPWP